MEFLSDLDQWVGTHLPVFYVCLFVFCVVVSAIDRYLQHRRSRS